MRLHTFSVEADLLRNAGEKDVTATLTRVGLGREAVGFEESIQVVSAHGAPSRVPAVVILEGKKSVGTDDILGIWKPCKPLDEMMLADADVLTGLI